MNYFQWLRAWLRGVGFVGVGQGVSGEEERKEYTLSFPKVNRRLHVSIGSENN